MSDKHKPFSDQKTAIQTWHHATQEDANRVNAELENGNGRMNKHIDATCCSALHTCKTQKLTHDNKTNKCNVHRIQIFETKTQQIKNLISSIKSILFKTVKINN